MQYHFEVNVAERTTYQDGRVAYKHLFATAERSITDVAKAQHIADMLRRAFPAPQYEVTVTEWEATGTPPPPRRHLAKPRTGLKAGSATSAHRITERGAPCPS
jgi:hypothetical protein